MSGALSQIASPAPRQPLSPASRSVNRTHNAEHSTSKPRPPNRFGFKKRNLPEVQQMSLLDGTEGDEQEGREPINLTPIDFIPPLQSALGDLNSVASALKLKAQASQYEYKAKMTEQSDMIKQLKGALKGQLERCRNLSQVLAPMQEEANGRLQTLGQEATFQKGLSLRLQSDLEASREQSEERGRRAREFKEALTTTQSSLNEQLKVADAERVRADKTEAELRERSGEVERLLRVETELRASGEAAEAAATLAASQAAERQAELQRQADAQTKRFEEQMGAAEEQASFLPSFSPQPGHIPLSDPHVSEPTLTHVFTRFPHEQEASLQQKLAAAVARGDELAEQAVERNAKFETLTASNAALKESHAVLERSNASQTTSVTMMTSQIEELKSSLQQKDGDLRQTMSSLSEMQRANTEQVSKERTRADTLDGELRKTRDAEADLSRKLQTAAADVERLTATVSSQKEIVSEQGASLKVAEAARDRQAIQLSEQSDELKKLKENLEKMGTELGEKRETLATRTAEAAKTEENLARVTEIKHKLQVEFDSYKEHHGTSNTQQMAAISDLKLTVDRLSNEVQHKETVVVTQTGNLSEQTAVIDSLQQRLLDAENMRRTLHNHIQEMKGNIRVFCRVRPPLPGAEQGLRACTEAGKLSLGHNSESYSFGFDKVFGSDAPQPVVFEEVDGLVQSALDGYKVCIFAYGQTGSGKTFTMQGTKERANWGLIPRSLSKILTDSNAMRPGGWEWSLEASFLEVYNEQLRDLLHEPKRGPAASLAIKHDEAWGTVVANAITMPIKSMEQINELIAKAGKARAVGSTDMNAQSSRSHSIFALYLHGVNEAKGTELHGALHLVDLAGSERLDKSGATGERLRETQSINKSLSSLADVFMAKSENQPHVPFRNSKLTHLMQPCLSGHGKTLMVVNVGPEADNSHETLCSLRFASQVNQCDTGGKPKRNAKPTAAGAPGGGAAGGAKSTVGAKTAAAKPSAAGTRGPTGVRGPAGVPKPAVGAKRPMGGGPAHKKVR